MGVKQTTKWNRKKQKRKKIKIERKEKKKPFLLEKLVCLQHQLPFKLNMLAWTIMAMIAD